MAAPNIIFICVDDLGWGDLACYGNLHVKTPHLDRLADEGLLLEQFYVNAPLCSPSRVGAFCGRFPACEGIHYWMHPPHNAAYGMPDYLDPRRPNLATTLRAAGHRTAHFGKWHMGEHPDAPIAAYGFDEVDIVWQGIGPNPGIPANDHRGTELLVDRSIRFIEDCRVQSRPFFINLWPRDVHAALNPGAEALARYRHLMSQGQFTTAMQIYYAAIDEMDRQIGRLVAYIDGIPGLAEDTLICFTSDNGPEDPYIPHASHHCVGLAGPFRGRKRSLYEGGVRLPFIARWRGHIPAGTVDRTSVVSAVDLLPTIAALADQTVPDDLDGEDCSGLFSRGTPHRRQRALYWEWRFDGVGQCNNRSPMLAVRDGNWKLLCNPDGSRCELYDIVRQPMELHSVADRHPDVVARLRDQVVAWQKTLPPGPATDRPGSDAYPGYPENAGRGPHMHPDRYRTLTAAVRVSVGALDVAHD